MNTSELVARGVDKLRRRQFVVKPPGDDLPAPSSPTSTVVDASKLRASLVANATEVRRWELVLAPTLTNALYCFYEAPNAAMRAGLEPTRTSVVMLHSFAVEADEQSRRLLRGTVTDAEWSRAKWAVVVTMYMDDHKIGLCGPMAMWPMAIAADGALVKYQISMPFKDQGGPSQEVLDSALLIWFASVNFLNCTNVTLLELKPVDRPAARRMARLGVQVHELVVRSMNEVYSGQTTGAGTPLTTVRGHFAHYGERYGRQKLFGRLEGRYWIPQHARGSAEHGVVERKYRIEPD